MKEEVKLIAKALKPAMQEAINFWLEGASNDAEQYATAIAQDAAEAAFLGRDDLIDALEMQLKMLAERHRLRAEASAWRAFRQTVRVLVMFASSAATHMMRA